MGFATGLSGVLLVTTGQELVLNGATLLIIVLSFKKSVMKQLLLLSLMLTIICLSCKKDKVPAGENVEFYLLKSYQIVSGKCQIDASASTIQDTPIVKNQDILQYSKSNYEFTLTENGIKEIKKLTDRNPFALVVDKQVIYYGIIKPNYSSSICSHSITMDNAIINNKITMSPPSDRNIDDQRNNSKLLATLSRQGKLK